MGGRPCGAMHCPVCARRPVYDDIIETWEHEHDADLLTAVCIAKRHGSTPVTARFSVMDAKRAGLWTKAGPWQTYPRRMLQMRARSFALRDAFPDVLKGLISVEEALDNHSGADQCPRPRSEGRRALLGGQLIRPRRRGWRRGRRRFGDGVARPARNGCPPARPPRRWTSCRPRARRTRRTSPRWRRSIPSPPPRSPRNSIVRCQSLGKIREQPSGRAHLRTPPDRTRSPSKLLIEAVGARRYSTSQRRLFAAAQSPAARAGS